MATVGISTSCLYPMATELALKTALEAGVRNLEVHFSTFSELGKGYLKELKKMMRHYGGRIHSVHPFYSALESAMFFSDYGERRFADGLEIYRQFFETAASLGADYLVFHGGQNVGKARVMVSQDEYIERYNRIVECGKSFGVTLLHENVYTHIAQTPDFCRKLIEYLGDKALFTYDNKQARRAGFDQVEFLRAISGHVRHIHISDYDSEHDCLLPGRGITDFAAMRNALSGGDDKACWVIEVYDNAFADVDEIGLSLKFLSMKLEEAEKTLFTNS
jgi:Sugar phosphate isomerases/epimerases